MLYANQILIRQSRESDGDFAYQTLEWTMRQHAVSIFGKWLESQARQETAADARSGRSQIIQLGSERVGLLCFERLATHFQLDQLFIVPEHQRQGIGGHVLRLILAQARATRLPVRLRLLRGNPAKRLYARHGFVVVSETPERFFMECAVPESMWVTANRFKAGHRLRLDITSSDFPRFDRNTNRGGEPGDPIPATQTIYHDARHPSQLIFSVVS